MNRIIILITIIFLSIATFTGYYFLNNPKINNNNKPYEVSISTMPEKKETTEVFQIDNELANTKFTKIINKITDIYSEKDDVINYLSFDAGKISTGTYKDYDKILVVIKKYKEKKLFDLQYQLFATKDYKNLISDREPGKYPNTLKVEFYPEINLKIDSLSIGDKLKIDENLSLRPLIKFNNFVSIEKDSFLEYKRETSDPVYTFPGAVNYDQGFEEKNLFGVRMLMGKNSTETYIYEKGIYYSYTPVFNFKNGTQVINTVVEEENLPKGIKLPKNFNKEIKFQNYDLGYKHDVSYGVLIRLNIPEEDMELVTEGFGPGIYQIKNKNNLEYKNIAVNKYEQRVGIEEEVKINFQNNIKNGAILFIKYPMGGFIPLFENDETRVMMGGGKPVLYLYPEKDTNIEISFDNPMQFANVVPNYENKWSVKANPNGKLKDLLPEKTDCSKIKLTSSTTYAKEACEKNEYPYLYWSGAVYNTFMFPEQKTGFVVKKENLEKFFDEKLSFIGFNSQEITDFKEFWIPELNSKKMEYFTINFLQNEELNSLFPMTINPKPDTIIRVFMDWKGYNFEPKIYEQKLNKYERKGYVLTEWGGRKK